MANIRWYKCKIKRFINQALQTAVSLQGIYDRIAQVFLHSLRIPGISRSLVATAKCQSEEPNITETEQTIHPLSVLRLQMKFLFGRWEPHSKIQLHAYLVAIIVSPVQS